MHHVLCGSKKSSFYYQSCLCGPTSSMAAWLTVGGVARWLGRQSLGSGLSLAYG